MNRSVHFNNQFLTKTNEINDGSRNLTLSTEFMTGTVVSSEPLPGFVFCDCGITKKFGVSEERHGDPPRLIRRLDKKKRGD